MKMKFNNAGLVALFFVAAWFAAVAVRAQQNAPGHASKGFILVQYYDPPFERQMKTRMSGASGVALEGGLFAIKQLKLEMFSTNGATEAVVEAPECVYDLQMGVANSPGHLQLRTGDGNLRIEGDGFLWRRTNQWLTISNHVQTMIEGALESKTGL
jgi:hypothetical protein